MEICIFEGVVVVTSTRGWLINQIAGDIYGNGWWSISLTFSIAKSSLFCTPVPVFSINMIIYCGIFIPPPHVSFHECCFYLINTWTTSPPLGIFKRKANDYLTYWLNFFVRFAAARALSSAFLRTLQIRKYRNKKLCVWNSSPDAFCLPNSLVFLRHSLII